jgi:predicted deacylase
MIERRHSLLSPTPGTSRELISLHYGPAGTGRKVAIQASLHADEVPGLLVAHHLRRRLGELEAQGVLQGEIVLVPFANPVGLSQWVLGSHEGRFDLVSGENFNRLYADLAPRATEILEPRVRGGANVGVSEARAALLQACAELTVTTELQSLRRTLLGLAIDAEVVLDLHCDNEAVLHLYTLPALWPEVEPLARLTGSRAALVADVSGDEPFDEACSAVWQRLGAALSERTGRKIEFPAACVGVTVELRGERDVTHELATADAEAILQYLAWRGFISGAPSSLPQLACEPTPLAGSIPVLAPLGGVLVHARLLGSVVRRGEVVAEIVDPLSGGVTRLESPTDGVLYARESRRFVTAGTRVCKVAGREPVRSGKLLSD